MGHLLNWFQLGHKVLVWLKLYILSQGRDSWTSIINLTAIPSTNPNWRAYSVKSRRGLNQIPDPHKFWDELDSKLADMAIDGKWFGKTLFDKNSWNKFDVQKLTNNEICLISNFETLSQVLSNRSEGLIMDRLKKKDLKPYGTLLMIYVDDSYWWAGRSRKWC